MERCRPVQNGTGAVQRLAPLCHGERQRCLCDTRDRVDEVVCALVPTLQHTDIGARHGTVQCVESIAWIENTDTMNTVECD